VQRCPERPLPSTTWHTLEHVRAQHRRTHHHTVVRIREADAGGLVNKEEVHVRVPSVRIEFGGVGSGNVARA
jgi:hypothetical protein